jgi:hypothetical protein
LLLRALAPGDHAPTTIALGKNLQAAVEQIRARDPNFSQQRFMRWATQTYLSQRQPDDPTNVALQRSDLFGVIITDATEYAMILFLSIASGGKKVTEAAVFSRPAGSQTPPPLTAAPNSVCTECGAPLSAGESACRFCGTPIRDDTGSWKFDKISVKGTDALA